MKDIKVIRGSELLGSVKSSYRGKSHIKENEENSLNSSECQLIVTLIFQH